MSGALNLLALYGVKLEFGPDFPEQLQQARLWD